MTIREQYKLAYSMLRERSWDYRTYRIICDSSGIDEAIRLSALRSYQNSRLIDEIGLNYRYKARFFFQLALERKIGYLPYLTRDLTGKDSKGIDYGINSHPRA